MAHVPGLTDYVKLINRRWGRFRQVQVAQGAVKSGRPFTYSQEQFIIFFTLMQYRRIHTFKAQRRWLLKHARYRAWLGWPHVPHRTTLSRRYKALYGLLQTFVQFVAVYVSGLDSRLRAAHLVVDKSLFKARGPVWHQSDRKAGRVPKGLRKLDREATCSKSGYHGWVYGYGLHVTCNEYAFPLLLAVETAAVSESEMIERQAALLLDQLQPCTVSGDDGYTKALRIRHWAQRGVILLTPALKWVTGRYARAYHLFIQQPDIALHLLQRRCSVEPLFDLVAKILGLTATQKQLPVQGAANVRSALALAVLSLQVAMIANSIWGLPLRNISHMTAAFQ